MKTAQICPKGFVSIYYKSLQRNNGLGQSGRRDHHINIICQIQTSLIEVRMRIIAFVLCLLIAPITSAGEAKHSQLVKLLLEKVSENYVMEEKLTEITRSLSDVQMQAEFNELEDPAKIAEILNLTLQQHDKHFGVRWSNPTRKDDKLVYEGWFSKLDRKHSGFKKVEILEGNIGYIDFWGFDNVNAKSESRAHTALQFVSESDALIFDLRNNRGGSADMVRLISSYLLEGRVHLSSIYWKESDSTTEFWTYADIENGAQSAVPVYVLTSKATFSAAEEFAYNLQALKRATIIGEVTKGGANPWKIFDLTDSFRVAIPIAKAVNPITNRNWEGVGVQPDIVTSKDGAFSVAYKLALEELQSSKVTQEQLKEIEEALQSIK
ncbi:S41 family peptidase [Microbulbifer discodermiae]|uniref:S41 family peptidase n=1 Tax=Microbulbifer sp. 2201CG32-9 TaxID=3232309 RepID=UPI00345C4B62